MGDRSPAVRAPVLEYAPESTLRRQPTLSVQGSEHRQEWDPSGPSAEHQACIWTAPNIRVLGTRVLKISQKKQQNGNF